MATTHNNFKAFYQKISIVYYVIVIGYVLFMAMAYMASKKHALQKEQPDLNMLYILLIIGVLIYFARSFLKNFFFQTKLQKLDIREKLNLYFTCFIVNIAFIEGFGFFNIILFMEYQDMNFLIFAGYALLLMLFLKPYPDKIADLLRFSKDEKVYINQPDKLFG